MARRYHSGGATDCDCATCSHNDGDHDQCEMSTCEDLVFDAAEFAKGYLEATALESE